MSSDSQSVEAPAKPSGRLPSLNQLAARIKPDAASSNPANPAAGRPRLAAFGSLRTGSNTSLSTVASTADSTAVNAPGSTRAASPSNLSTSPPQSETPIPADVNPSAGDPLTSEGLEKLNEETTTGTVKPNKSFVKGYKNVPSLDAIRARLVKNRTLSIDGTSQPPEPEMIEDPKTPGIQVRPPEHPLQFKWTLFHDTKSNKYPFTPATATGPDTNFSAQAPPPTESTEYEAGLSVIGEFATVEEYCRYFNWLKPPSHLEKNSNYHMFKQGIKPMWEDEANANGGKWVLTMKNNPQLLDRCWSWVTMALVGEELEDSDEICGAVVSLRSKVDRIQVWTRSKDDVEKLNGIGKKLVKLLDVSEADGIGLEFQYNTEDRPQPNKFLSIQAVPTSSFRPSFQADGSAPGSAGAGGGGAFGSFGVGSWKKRG